MKAVVSAAVKKKSAVLGDSVGGEWNRNQPGKLTVDNSIRAFQRETSVAKVKRADINSGIYCDLHLGHQ